MLNNVTPRAANEDARLVYTADTPVTLRMLLEIARAAHRECHMPGCPPSYAVALVNAIEDLIPNPWQGG